MLKVLSSNRCAQNEGNPGQKPWEWIKFQKLIPTRLRYSSKVNGESMMETCRVAVLRIKKSPVLEGCTCEKKEYKDLEDPLYATSPDYFNLNVRHRH